MSDPLAQIVGLLRPSAAFSKLVEASGAWSVRREDAGRPFYCAVLDGRCRLSVAGEVPIALEGGDFVLIPAAQAFTMASLEPSTADGAGPGPAEVSPGVFRLGDGGAPDVRALVGHAAFASPDAGLLVPLLPRVLHVRSDDRLSTLVALLAEEARNCRPGRDTILARLLEVLLIEALRAGGAGPAAAPGLLRGLADERIAAALRLVHADPRRAWTGRRLAREAGLSRSVFFERFRREVGAAPADYLLAWRMALARDMLGRGGTGVGEVAERVGYGSATAFGAAFARHAGVTPTAYARAQGANRGAVSLPIGAEAARRPSDLRRDRGPAAPGPIDPGATGRSWQAGRG